MRLRYLLDTNILSEPISKRPNKKVLRLLNERGNESAVAETVRDAAGRPLCALRSLAIGALRKDPSARAELLALGFLTGGAA